MKTKALCAIVLVGFSVSAAQCQGEAAGGGARIVDDFLGGYEEVRSRTAFVNGDQISLREVCKEDCNIDDEWDTLVRDKNGDFVYCGGLGADEACHAIWAASGQTAGPGVSGGSNEGGVSNSGDAGGHNK